MKMEENIEEMTIGQLNEINAAMGIDFIINEGAISEIVIPFVVKA